ncbi:hydroxymethylpyrimidine/phosphomethylpyrimidine kinase [Rhodoferax sp. OV413]|uniref:bifunctional hydroxymethylpyrimidine kinase/phosphomethylpyrimidine kinase n=1 Tax=Rhodoferax sp. OV413 TaxID=1855285 RepID=UPI00088B3785|nr:bifunctional hydroxymethylpyrimidine kinase/phosphomethylpyrimidine kinase [Rhodoferax sp. OV413]SDO08323.1 hydroxymethylpyrimidine/phosphomethylpyrimidine kinase [Rhodoferax sp. OV413]
MTISAPSSRYLRLLSIAGSDSGGGAGIQADLKTFGALGCYGMTALAALTAQNTRGVRAIHPVPPAFLKSQLEAVLDDIGADAVKIGMLHSPEMVDVVAWAIDHYQLKKVVLDPVMVATSGDRLMAQETVQVLVQQLFPRATVVTPNLDEASLLLGRSVDEVAALEPAVASLLALGAPAVLVKGGHLPGADVVDLLGQADGSRQSWQSPRIATPNGHGTGCTLSSAIAVYLAQGQALPAAVELARSYILGAISAGAGVRTGQGQGPLNHGFAPLPMQLVNL